MKINLKVKTVLLDIVVCILSGVLCLEVYVCSFADEGKQQQLPVTVNGDNVEYSPETKEVSATGNVQVDYKGTKLTSDKLIVNTETKDAKTEGPTRVEDNDAVVEGSQISYNFANKTGIITDARFRSYPYFGKAKEMKKVSDKEFVGYRGYATTCEMDFPHYRIGSKRINLFPNDKIKTRHDKFYLGNLPVAYMPFYNHSLKDPMFHIQMTPGKSKAWGPYLLTATRYNITDKVTGRVYYDQRSRIGNAQGFGANYDTGLFGKGDFKFYYTQERSPDFKEW
ncbi:LPS-assembly protein LptD, partial [bacterium]